jgi:O-antigen/teichoic acid export membrane protein
MSPAQARRVEHSETATTAVAKLFGSRLGASAISLIFAAWLFRIVPKKELAIWPACIALSVLVVRLASLGIGDTFTRLVPTELARGNLRRVRGMLRVGLAATLAFSGIQVLVMYFLAEPVAALLLKDRQWTGLVRLMTLAVFFLVAQERLQSALLAVQRFASIALLRFVSDACRLPLTVLLYVLFGPRGMIAAFTVVQVCACAVCVAWLWPYLAGRAAPGSGRRLVGAAPSFYGTQILGYFAQRVDYLLLGLLTSREALATYFVADRIAEVLTELRMSVISVISPKLAERRGSPAA